MHGVITVIIIIILTAMGITLFRSGTRSYVAGEDPFILINAKNTESIEYTVRRALRRYPECVIYIFNRSEDPEMQKILSALERETPRIHIIS